MSKGFFQDILADVGNDVKASIAEEGTSSSEFSGYIDTGCYILNALLSSSIFGGMPDNKVLGLAGESSTGKTFFALSIAKHFLIQNPESFVFYYDTETAVTKDMLVSRDIDVNRFVIVEPITIQDFRTHIIKVLDNYSKTKEEDRPKMMVCLDSLGNLPSQKELEDATDGKDVRDMTKAQLWRSVFRILSQKFGRMKVPMITTNHTYDIIGSYVPMKKMGGGDGFRYNADQIAYLFKKKDKDGTDVVGNILKIKLDKSRITKQDSECEVKLSYSKGLDRYYGLLELGEKHGLVKKVGTRYEINGDETKVYAKTVYENPEKYFTDDFLQKLDEAAKKEFSYGEEKEEYPD